ncbi:Spindle and kinetochore-associated protein 1 [Blattella germanica]|nr:Spindle and kinetochore-associated protein 1 [Blattella germanica]
MDKLIKEVDLLTQYKDIITGHDPYVTELCLKLKEEIQQIKNGLGGLRSVVDDLKEQVSISKEISKTLEDTQMSIEHMSNNLPNKYVYIGNNTEIESLATGLMDLNIPDVEEMTPIPVTGRYVGSPDLAESCSRRRQLNVYRSSISYLTQEEYEKIPRYMRGRMTYETINNFIDEFNVALKKKYDIFGRPRAYLKGKMLSLYDRFKKEETTETVSKGIFFCTGQDLKEYSKIKMDKSSQNLLNILRSTRRIKEIRTPGVVRYAVA